MIIEVERLNLSAKQLAFWAKELVELAEPCWGLTLGEASYGNIRGGPKQAQVVNSSI